MPNHLGTRKYCCSIAIAEIRDGLQKLVGQQWPLRSGVQTWWMDGWGTGAIAYTHVEALAEARKILDSMTSRPIMAREAKEAKWSTPNGILRQNNQSTPSKGYKSAQESMGGESMLAQRMHDVGYQR